MKKIYLFIAFVVMTATASAQVQDERKLMESWPVVISAEFTYNGKPLLISGSSSGEGLDEKRIITIYNDDIEKVHEFEITGCRIEYTEESQKLNTETNEWVTTDSYQYVFNSLPEIWFTDADGNSYVEDDDYDNMTQTLFNTDEKFEYIRFDYDKSVETVTWEKDRDGDGVIDYRTVRRGGKCIGFSIVQEDGTVLQSVNGDFDSNICVWRINGKMYLMMEENSTDGYSFFRIDTNASSVKQVAMIPGMRVRPSVADRDAQVTVELEDDAAEIQVLNAAGQTVKRIPVSDGQRQIVFNARGLNKGVNMVRAKGRNSVSRKFIVR